MEVQDIVGKFGTEEPFPKNTLSEEIPIKKLKGGLD